MTASRRRRPLTPGEARLWAEIARDIAPLKGRPTPSAPAPVREPPATSVEPPRPAARIAAAKPAAAKPAAPRPAVAPLAPVDLRTQRGMARGRLRADATLDLHGLHQVEAHAALARFLHGAQSSGHRLVTVVTGKGRPGEAPGTIERGVLRRMVPHWLALPALRTVVLGWVEAAPHRGGAGALHVRLRAGRR